MGAQARWRNRDVNNKTPTFYQCLLSAVINCFFDHRFSDLDLKCLQQQLLSFDQKGQDVWGVL